MRKEPEDRDMLPEYDFSNAVRGKHASRFRERREELLEAAAAMDRQAWLAYSLEAFQTFEAMLVAYWSLVFGDDPSIAGKRVSGLLEAIDKKATKSLWSDLRRHTSAGEEFHNQLVTLLADRNWLVHRSFYKMDRPGHAPAGMERFESIAARSHMLATHLWAYLLERCAAEGLDRAEVEARTEEVVGRWAAERSAA